MISIRDVAEQAGVSIGTVSKVLNHPQSVSAHTRERVQHVIDHLGYVRNASAHQLRAGRSNAIGLVVHDVTNPFFTEVASGVEQAANAANAIVILCNAENSIAREQQYLRTLEEQRVQGVLLFPLSGDVKPLEQLHGRGMGVVLLDQPRQLVNLSWVSVDDVRGAELVGTHLLQTQYLQIGYVRGPLHIHQCVDRRRGLERAITSVGRDPKQVIADIPVQAHTIVEGQQAAAALLKQSHLPQAIFCVNDLVALGLMSTLIEQGVRVPDDVAIVGYDDVAFAQVMFPSLSSVRYPKAELGRTATRLLLEEVANPQHHHQQIVYQPELVVRASSQTRRA